MTVRVLRGNLILPDRIVEGGQIVVENGIIQEVVEDADRYPTSLDFGSSYLAPGFIDVHVHGIAGMDTMDGSPESVRRMAQRFAAHGVTSFLPTTVTQSLEATVSAIGAVREHMSAEAAEPSGAARALGLHLEGPWIATKFKGAQNERFIRAPDEETVRSVLSAADGAVRIVTLAPELPGADHAIRLLRAAGVYVSIGHTGATHAEARRAVDLGATHVTHCFNAMSPLHHREPGTVGTALTVGDLFAELIADGVHVHPDAMRLLIRVKSRERVMLITDAMSAAELPDGTYDLGGQDVFVRDGEARLHDGTLAGSTLVLDQAVRNLVHLCGVSLVDAVYMASTTPATAIGLGERKGRIRAGFDADLTVLDAHLRPVQVMICGFSRPDV